jgi:uncharacterized protein (DUF4415 family)
MKGKRTFYGEQDLLAEDRTDWKLVRKMKDKDIDYSDDPATDEAFWADAEWIIPGRKIALGVRFDKAVVSWFKSLGPGYQTKMNAVLRQYMEHQLMKTSKPPAPKTPARKSPAPKKRKK